MGTRTKGRAYFHLVTPTTSPGQRRMDRSDLPSFGVSAPTSLNSDPMVHRHRMAKSPPWAVSNSVPTVQDGGDVEELW